MDVHEGLPETTNSYPVTDPMCRMAARGTATTPRRDWTYASVAGLYVAAFLAPASTLVLSQVTGDAATLYVGFLVAVTTVTAIAGWATTKARGLAVRLGGTDAVWVLVVLPFAWFGGVIAGTFVGLDLPRIAAPLGVFGTGAGMFLGIVLVGMSRTRHADAALAGARSITTWEARWPRSWRRVATGGAILAFGATAVGFVAVFGFGLDWGWRLYYLLLVAVPLVNVLNPRRFEVTDRGLVVDHPLQRQFRPWARYEGYGLTDSALRIHPREWWRPAHRCDVSDIGDVTAAVTGLDAVLDRIE